MNIASLFSFKALLLFFITEAMVKVTKHSTPHTLGARTSCPWQVYFFCNSVNDLFSREVGLSES